jgi:hypothetical protein
VTNPAFLDVSPCRGGILFTSGPTESLTGQEAVNGYLFLLLAKCLSGTMEVSRGCEGGEMVGLGIYLLAGAALFFLWSTDYRPLSWAIAGSAVLMFITAETVKTAYRQVMQRTQPVDLVDAYVASQEAKHHKVVRFWVKVNFVFTCLTAVLSLVGLVLALFGRQ